ncbi:MAG: hypothetical protein IJ366_01095 [Clostridia bacterium]|nr:hypothetical protein [Clostridia bacterium]
MIKEIMNKFVIENAVELVRSFVNYVINKKYAKCTSYEKYLINSCKRKCFNNVHLSDVEIMYIFKENDLDRNIVSLDVEYILKGTANEKINDLVVYFNMKEFNVKNISIKAYDCANGEEKSVTAAILSKDSKIDFCDNGAYWKIPFYDRNPGHMDEISTKIVVSWKRFCPVGEVATLIVDPRNYSKSINSLTITVKNEADSFDIEYIKLSEYNRKTRKPDKNGREYDIYNIGNGSDSDELVRQKKLLKNEINENIVFLMKVKC